MTSIPPKHISDSVLNSISKALEEEKQPRINRWKKIVLWTIVVAAVSLIPFLVVADTESNLWPILSCVFWTGLLGLGFSLYFRPQPRLAVPGYWSPWVYAKVISGPTLGTVVTFLVCPSFAFVPTKLSWIPFEHLTMSLMHIGGMGLCMVFCGFLFSILISLFAFASTARVLARTRVKKLLLLAGLVVAAQLPILAFQVFAAALRPTALHWLAGGIAGAFLGVLIVSRIGLRRLT